MPLDPLTPELLSRLESLEVRARTIVDHVFSGRHRGRQRGMSTDFAEHREYSPGDDVRSIDWKLFGRRDRFHVRQYEQDSRLKAWLLVDVSPSMNYRSGEQGMSKLDYACCLAAALGWICSRQQDEPALAAFALEGAVLAPPRAGAAAWQELCRQLDLLTKSSNAAIGGEAAAELEQWTSLSRLVELVTPRSLIFIFTDAFGDETALVRQLVRFKCRRCDVRLIHILDPAEIAFPFDEDVTLADMEGTGQRLVTSSAIKPSYQREVAAFLDDLERRVRGQGLGYHRVTTDQPLDRAMLSIIAAGQ